MNINRINCRHTIRIIRSCRNTFRSTYRNTFRIACRITCRMNSLETHFEIYSPSIGVPVCKNVSISRNKRTNQSKQNTTKQTKQGYAMRYGNVQRPRPTSNRRDRCYGAESLMFVWVSQRHLRQSIAAVLCQRCSCDGRLENFLRRRSEDIFRIACRVACRINSLETHFEIYSPSIGVQLYRKR